MYFIMKEIMKRGFYDKEVVGDVSDYLMLVHCCIAQQSASRQRYQREDVYMACDGQHLEHIHYGRLCLLQHIRSNQSLCQMACKEEKEEYCRNRDSVTQKQGVG